MPIRGVSFLAAAVVFLKPSKLGEKLIAEVGRVSSGIKLKSVTVVDAAIIGAPKIDEE
ncbi:hypothetical protein [Paraburkholderia youngii]|uniref:hypothetical protein n=1 Tax=Paraburkholderia youngii TaxID=2782701 RepID=UPI0015951CA8|nr:hypothetical protein [Paraburkholderia youngii]